MDNTTLDYFNIAVYGILAFILVFKLIRSVRLVPTQSAYIVERLGKYKSTLEPGFHALMPFLDKVNYVLNLKEETIIVPPQDCFTFDNVLVEVDGVLYISVIDPYNAAYGVTDYRLAAVQLAQTTTRSVIGTIDLDRTFEERDLINSKVVEALSEVSDEWGITVHRYEVKNIVTPKTVRNAMEQQMSAERERRAIIARSEGDRQSRINRSEGLRREMVNRSEGEKQRRINEAEGRSREIEAIADATAESIEKLAIAISDEGGSKAFKMRLSQEYLTNIASLADPKTKVVLPLDVNNINDMLNSIASELDTVKEEDINK